MASTRFRMIGVALFVVALSALEAMQWEGGPEDKAKITACPGSTVSFDWSIAMGSVEKMLVRDWFFQPPGQDERTLIATYIANHFYAPGHLSVGFLPNAGLSVHEVRPQDSGNYSVRVEIEEEHGLASVWRTVTLSVTGRPPATQDGALHVTLSDAVRDDVTKDWTLQLHCGPFVDLGFPPVDVVWKTPSSEVRNSSNLDNGTFVLSVSSPVQAGNYSCHLPPSAPAVRCLTATSPLNAAAQLYVDDKDVRLSFLDARLIEKNGIIEDTKQVNKKQAMQLQKLGLRLNQTMSELTTQCLFRPGITSSCVDWLSIDKSGPRSVCASGELIDVYCDQTKGNLGWLVFQRRMSASVDFFRDWTDYRTGFGDLEGNFWLGLDKLHKLTTSQRYELRVEVQLSRKPPYKAIKGYSSYSGFYVEDASHNFTLRYENFTGGNARDALAYQRNQQFTTKDRDNDKSGRYNCADYWKDAWWFNDCPVPSLNGVYETMVWGTFGDKYDDVMNFTEMKIRPMWAS